jgi:hypothetical protein
VATLGTLKQRILSFFRGSTSAAAEADVVAAINDAVEYYQREELWFREATASFNLVAGNSNLSSHASFPADFWFLRGDAPIVITQNNMIYPLCKLSVSDFDNISSGSSGRPAYYRELSSTIEIYPLPDSTYNCEIRYIKKYDALSTDGQSNDWLVYAPQLIEARALSRLFLTRGHDGEKMHLFWKEQEIEQARALRVTHNRRVATGNLDMEY